MSGCAMSKSCIVSLLAVFAFMFGYDFVVHGMLLQADYTATAALWRTEAEMQEFGVWCIFFHAVLALLFTCWFKKVRSCHAACADSAAKSCCPIKSGGLCFGIKIGLLMGILHAWSYVYMPIPSSLALKWFLASLGQGIGVGVILGMLCKGSACGSTSCGTKA